MEKIWKPHVTVASVLEQDGKFLVVEEDAGSDGIRFNQPAGHWEPGETLIAGASREVLEESGYHFTPEWLVGIYSWKHPNKDITYLRFAFGGRITGHEPDRPLDTGIIRPVWLSPEEIRANAPKNRSPLVARCVDDYLAGHRYPLELLTHF